MFKIKTMNKISPLGLDKFPLNMYKCGEETENPDAIIVRSADLHTMEFSPNLRAIARAGAGVNNIPLEKCSEKGIVVFNTPGSNANAVKELTFMGLLISARKVLPGIEWAKTLKGKGEEVSALVEKGKAEFDGPELKGKTLGVIGLGAIGSMVANLALSFEMKVYGYDPFLNVNTAWNLDRAVYHATTLDEIYKNCDFITLHIPATPETRGMINSESIKAMKHGVRIMNFSRSDLIIPDDVALALQRRAIRSYVTDFPCDSLIDIAGAVQIPHLGASTPESEDNSAVMAALELRDFLENGNIKNSVNLPAVHMPRGDEHRIAVIHRNIPKMINHVTTAISHAGINIENMMNNSRKDYAYTIADTADKINPAAIAALHEIDGIIRVTPF
jgi:D-3-phosphoglycerate dehydrogenase